MESESLSIACLIHSLNGGGAERVMAGLVSRLAGRGHRVTLITFSHPDTDRYPVDESVERVTLGLTDAPASPLFRLAGVFRRHAAIRNAVQSVTPQVLLSFCDRNNIDVLSALRKGSLPVIVCERSDPAKLSLGWIRNRIRRQAYPRAAAVVALTESAARHLSEFCNNVQVIPSAVDTPPISSARDSAAENKLIVGVGRLEYEKGFDRLIEAFAAATLHHPSWRLALYGEGSQRADLQQQIAELGLHGRVEMHGWVRPLWESLAQATIFCLPSRYEGFPSALLEAMAVGVPSISVDCESGPRAIVRTGENGLLVDPSIEGLSEGIRRWIEDPNERERIGLVGSGVIEEFGWERMVDAYETLVRRTATQGMRGRRASDRT
ncbi:MAG: glycosyltransferase family 4 protein [Planctomycetota bacterium]